MTDRDTGSKDFPPMSDAEKAEWEKIFRENVKHLPATSEKWFSLGNGVDETGGKPDRDFQPSQLFSDYLAVIVEDINSLIYSGNSIKVPNYVDGKLVDAQEKFADNEGELRRIRGRLFYGKGSSQGYLVEKGPFQRLSHGNKLRSLAALSTGVDYMKGDIEFGYMTNYARAIAECFGYAEMQILQHRAVQKLFGGSTNLVYGNTLRPIPKLSFPQDKEIADLQRRVVNKLQKIM